jgi:hypothetical protein
MARIDDRSASCAMAKILGNSAIAIGVSCRFRRAESSRHHRRLPPDEIPRIFLAALLAVSHERSNQFVDDHYRDPDKYEWDREQQPGEHTVSSSDQGLTEVPRADLGRDAANDYRGGELRSGGTRVTENGEAANEVRRNQSDESRDPEAVAQRRPFVARRFRAGRTVLAGHFVLAQGYAADSANAF